MPINFIDVKNNIPPDPTIKEVGGESLSPRNSSGVTPNTNPSVFPQVKGTRGLLSFAKHALMRAATALSKSVFGNFINTVKNFFHKSPATQVLCKSLSIGHDEFTKLPAKLQKFIVESELISGEEDIPFQAKLATAKEMEKELSIFLEDKKGSCPELAAFHQKLQDSIQTMEEENNVLFQQIVLENKTIAQKAEYMSYKYGGETLTSSPIQVQVKGHPQEIKLSYVPQKQLSGYPGDPHLRNCSSETRGKLNGHIMNLWQHKIDIGGENLSFIRSGCTNGNEKATKELLANALSLKCDMKKLPPSSSDNPISLKFSNIQLLSSGSGFGPKVLTDGKLAENHMNALNNLAKQDSIELDYQGKKIFVKLEPPLLFNFGVNMQHFNKIFRPFVSHKASDAANLQGFRRLFGEHFPKISDWDGEVGEALKNDSLPQEKKKQIIALSKSIVAIYQKAPQGIASHPYALPTQTIMLTSLLGYPTSYNCKSGKDRTGACSMELTHLAVQLMGNKMENFSLPDPFAPISAEEQKNLQNIYFSGENNKIAETNTLQRNLKLPSKCAGIEFKGLDERFGLTLSKTLDENRKIFGK